MKLVRDYDSKVRDLTSELGCNIGCSDITEAFEYAKDYCLSRNFDLENINNFIDFLYGEYCYMITNCDMVCYIQRLTKIYNKAYISSMINNKQSVYIDLKYTFVCCVFGFLLNRNEKALGYYNN